MNDVRGGIEYENRQRLMELHRELNGPFTIDAAMHVWDLTRSKAQRMLAHLTEQGWLVRVDRGLYATVPLDTVRPDQWRVEPWLVAAEKYDPCYIGGWTASEHWDLTEQIFRSIVVISAAPNVRDRHPTIQGTTYWIKSTTTDMLFGLRSVWEGQRQVQVADPSRTVADVLDDPAIGGGIRHVSHILDNYLQCEYRDDKLLLQYIDRIGNRTSYKRLGYLLEVQQSGADALIDASRDRLSSGYSQLDPAASDSGPLLRRWNLQINVSL